MVNLVLFVMAAATTACGTGSVYVGVAVPGPYYGYPGYYPPPTAIGRPPVYWEEEEEEEEDEEEDDEDEDDDDE
jgi:hypothetical protein